MRRRRTDRGFTLVEILVVMIVIGILVGIAIPVFLRQRESGQRSRVKADLANAKVAIESWAVSENGGRFDASTAGTVTLSTATLLGAPINFKPSSGVDIRVGTGPFGSTDATSYCIEATHPGINGQWWHQKRAPNAATGNDPGPVLNACP